LGKPVATRHESLIIVAAYPGHHPVSEQTAVARVKRDFP